MCTIIINWTPGNYLIGANRDEEITRKCDDIWRDRGNYYAPQDLRGGTWIGVNKQGIFSAITNAITVQETKNYPKNSRGMLVKEALSYTNIESAIYCVSKLIRNNHFHGFNLIIGNDEELWLISGNGGDRSARIKPIYGKCIITADAPVVENNMLERSSQYNHRLEYIAKNIHSKYQENLYTNDVGKMYEILCYSADGYVDNAVCVKYDDSSNHLTRSSSIIRRENGKTTIYWTDRAPDVISIENWNTRCES